MKANDILSSKIIEAVGGKENVILVTHCMTRLRFQLKDYKKIDEFKFEKMEGIISTAKSAGEFQVIIGNSVDTVYKVVINQLGISPNDEVEKTKNSILTRVINTIVRVITPTLGVLVASGLLKGLLAILVALKTISPNDGSYIILNAIGDSIFYFFPIILGYTSAETFGLNKFIGMILGSTLLYPSLISSFSSGTSVYSLFRGTYFESNAYNTFFGLPVIFPNMGYAFTVIPIILINYTASKLEKFLKNKIPDIVGFAFVPFITLLVTAPLALLIIGPTANFLQNLISFMATSTFNFSPILATILIALIYQPLVIFGLHWPLITLAITNFNTLGYDYLWPMMFTASFAQTAGVIAVFLKTKNKKTKSLALPAFISGLMCIIEPAIYGFTLKDKKRFAFCCIGAACGGIIITITNSVQYVLGIGLLGFSGFINPSNGNTHNLIWAIVGTLITMIITFVLVYTFFTDVDMKGIKNSIDIDIMSPVDGKRVELTNIKDKTFSNEILGKTFAIYPDNGIIKAPFNAKVKSIFDKGHAIILVGPNDENILIHIGIDSINIEGSVFKKFVKQDDIVKKGDILINFNKELLLERNYDPTVIVVMTDSDKYNNIHTTEKESIKFDDIIMECRL